MGIADEVLVDERGAPLRAVSDVTVGSAYPRFSPDGQRVAIGAPFRGGPELWIYDLDSSVLSTLPMGFNPTAIDWSPDGRRVLAARGRGGGSRGLWRVWSRADDASDEATLFREIPNRRISALSLAPGGRTFAVVANSGSGTGSSELLDIHVAEVDGQSESTPFATGPAKEVAPRFSPKGRWLAYASDESGRFEVYVRPFPGPGRRVQVSDVGGGQPVWSADGARLFYRTQQALWVADLAERGENLSVSARTHLFEGDFFGGPESAKATYDVHPDGRRFIVSRAAGGSATEIVAWIDWLPEMKARLGG